MAAANLSLCTVTDSQLDYSAQPIVTLREHNLRPPPRILMSSPFASVTSYFMRVVVVFLNDFGVLMLIFVPKLKRFYEQNGSEVSPYAATSDSNTKDGMTVSPTKSHSSIRGLEVCCAPAPYACTRIFTCTCTCMFILCTHL